MAICALTIFALKDPTYDLVTYLAYFEGPHPYEPGFWLPSLFLSKVLELPPWQILLFWQVSIYYIISKALKNLGNLNGGLKLAVILGSTFFVLSSQNALRQGISAAFVLLFVSIIIRDGNFKKAILPAICASLMHSSGFFFILIFLAWNSKIKELSNKGRIYKILIPILIGITAVFVFQKFSTETYISGDVEWSDQRSSSLVKILAISAIFFTTNFLINMTENNKTIFLLKETRTFYYLFLLPTAFLPEGFSRLAFQYYALDLALSYVLLNSNIKNQRIAGAIIILSSGFAPNAINIITG